MKQTAVEWFYQRILSKDIKQVFEQAKAMEKEQIIDAYNSGQQIPPFEYAERFYQKAYGKTA